MANSLVNNMATNAANQKLSPYSMPTMADGSNQGSLATGDTNYSGMTSSMPTANGNPAGSMPMISQKGMFQDIADTATGVGNSVLQPLFPSIAGGTGGGAPPGPPPGAPVDPSTGQPYGADQPMYDSDGKYLGQSPSNSIFEAAGIFGSQPSTVPTEAQKAEHLQAANAKSFRTNLPGTLNTMTQNLRQQSNSQLNNTLNQVDTKNNQRGLLYGGLNAGQKGQVTNQARSSLGRAIGGVNNQMNDYANSLDNQVLTTGMAVQNSKQQEENAIYSRALASMNADNATTQGLLGLAMTAAILA